MLGFKVNEAKGMFFNPRAVLDPAEKAKRKKLSRFGAFVRRDARRSIRKVGKKGTSAKPGQPPKSRTGFLKDFIYFVYDAAADSVITGPVRLNGRRRQSVLATEALELGGEVIRDGKTYIYARHPYMKPAFDSNVGKVVESFKDSI